MANEEDIVQKIIMEGDRVVVQQFANIAKAGSDAFKTIQAAADKATSGGAFQTLTNALTNIRNGFTATGGAIGDFIGNARQFEQAVLNSAKRVGILTAAVTAAGVALGVIAKNGTEASDEIAKSANSLGLTNRQYQGLSFVAGQAGISQDTFTSSFTRFLSALDNTDKAFDDYKKGLRKLREDLGRGKIDQDGFNEGLFELRRTLRDVDNPLKDLNVQIARTKEGNIDAIKTFLNLADAVKESDDPVKTAAKVRELFGRGAGRMVGFLKQGSNAILEQAKDAKRLGIVIKDDVIKRQEELNDGFDKLSRAVTSTKQSFLVAFSPTILKFIDAIVEQMAKWRANSDSLAQTLANKVAPVVEQVLALLEGREQDIQGTFIQKFRDGIVDAANAVSFAFTKIIIPAFNAVLAVAQTVAEFLNSMFGTKLTGGAIIAAAVILKLVGVFGLLVGAVQLVVAGIALLAAAVGGPVTLALIALGALIGFVFGKQLLNLDWKGFVARAVAAFASLVTFLNGVWEAIKAGAQGVWDGIVNGVTATVTAIQGLWTAFVGWLVTLWENIKTGATAVWTWVSDQANIAVTYISNIFAGLRDTILGYWASIRDGILAVWDRVKGAIAAMRGSGGGDTQRRAGGGHVRGPGTGTSDSIMARLSNGEFVMRTAAVKKYGASFMSLVNSLRFDPEQMGFALGGLVSVNVPQPRLAFAGGGMVQSAGNTLNLTVGDQTFPGLRVTDDTFDELTKFATRKSVQSAGRKPSWKK